MNKQDRLAAALKASALSDSEIEEIMQSQISQKRTHRFYKIYLTDEQANELEIWSNENDVRFELANPIEKQRKYNPRKEDSS